MGSTVASLIWKVEHFTSACLPYWVEGTIAFYVKNEILLFSPKADPHPAQLSKLLTRSS